MFRLLYTLSQALSHCRLSHFIPIDFRTFALSRFIPAPRKWVFDKCKEADVYSYPQFFINILDRSAYQPVSESVPDQWASQVRQKEASAACSFRATWSDCSTTPLPQIKPTINRQTTKRISTTAGLHRSGWGQVKFRRVQTPNSSSRIRPQSKMLTPPP